MKKAFTMIELVVVIAVIGVIAGIAVPKLYNYRFDAELTKVKSEYKIINSKSKNKLLENIMKGELESFSDLGRNGTKIFTNIFKDGLESGNTSRGWSQMNNIYKYAFNSNTYFEFEYDKSKGSFECKKAIGNPLLNKAIECK